MTAYKVRLKDGVEVGPLDVQMMRSWYEQGMISRDSPVRPTGRKQWVRLIDAVDIGDWGAAGGSAVARARPGVGREADGEVVVTETGPAQRWRLFLGSILLFAAAGAAAYFFFLPERWQPDLRPLAWREVSLALAVLGLLLLLATEVMRKLVRGLVFLGTFALIPLAAFAIVPEIRPRALLALLAAWVMGSGLFFFLAAGHRGAKSVLLSLFWVLAGAAGVLYLGYVPPQPAGVMPAVPATAAPATVAAAPSLPPASAPASPAAATIAAAPPAFGVPVASPAPPATPDRTAALQNDVPLLSPLAAESLLGRGPFAPEQGLKVTYATATRALAALTREEATELSVLTRATYEAVPAEDRGRLTAYLDRARAAAATTPDEDRAMSALMRDAVLRLPEAQRARLQALFEKAILIAR